MRNRVRTEQGQGSAAAPGVIAWQLRHLDDATVARWTEATMRRLETPSVVDLAKRPGTLNQLSRLFDV